MIWRQKGHATSLVVFQIAFSLRIAGLLLCSETDKSLHIFLLLNTVKEKNAIDSFVNLIAFFFLSFHLSGS